MKELTIEQKAQRYDEALERAKDYHKRLLDEDNPEWAGEIEKLFPELKESEENDDERVRKAILALVRQSSEVLDKQNQNKMLAWLEKQGQQETDGWKEGNIIRHGGILALVIKGRRAIKSNGEIFTVQYPDEWVKAAPNEIEHFLNEFENQGEQKPFDYEEKKLKGVEQEPTAWSEEDERICQCLIKDQENALDEVNNDKYGHSEIISDLKEMYNERIAWLKSLKDRYTWKPSEEQIKTFEHFVRSIGESGYASPYENNTKILYSLLEQLKKL